MKHLVDKRKHTRDSSETAATYRDSMVSGNTSGAHIVVVGAGMVAHRFIESLLSRAEDAVRITLLGEEQRRPYDRVALTSFFTGSTAEELTLDRRIVEDERVDFLPGDPVVRIERADRRVVTRSGRVVGYDHLVLATGSYAARLAVDGFDLEGCFVYRTLDDVAALRAFVERRSAQLGRPLVGTVVGGGLLGLEAAGALRGLDVDCTVIQSSDRLMSAQLDLPAGDALRRLIETRGIGVRTGSITTRLDPDPSGQVAGLEFRDGDYARTDVVVFTVGVRPRDELARSAGLAVEPHGGVKIDEGCLTSDPAISAIGEVASFEGQCVGLVAPG